MPIVDYNKRNTSAKARFLASNSISAINKTLLLKYLDARDFSMPRRGIYLAHIHHLLEKTEDISKDMHDRDKINSIFGQMRKTMGQAQYGIMIDISMAFARWLNDGDKPVGFKDIKSKMSKLRDLVPDDMLTWEDAEKMMAATTSIQLKAIVAVQLDAGLRPSELIDLNYGDVRFERLVCIITIRGGKTGARQVICKRCVQILMRWCREHPTKKKNDPLWVMENITKSQRQDINQGIWMRYPYAAVQKRMRELGQRVGIKKPLDMYNFRHSSCVLDKKDNLPNDLGARRHGHSLKHYDAVYGRLSVDDLIDRTEKHYGISKATKPVDKGIICEACKFVNKPKADICEYCGVPLTVNKALEMRSDIEKRMASELAGYKREYARMQEELRQFTTSEIKRRIREVKRKMAKDLEKEKQYSPSEVKTRMAEVVGKH